MTTIKKSTVDTQVRTHMNAWMISAQSALRQFFQFKLLDEVSKDKAITVASMLLSPAELAISTFAPPVGAAVALIKIGVTTVDSVASAGNTLNLQRVQQQLESELEASKKTLHDKVLKIALQSFAKLARGELTYGSEDPKEIDRIYMESLPLSLFKYEILRKTPTGSWEIDQGKTTKILLNGMRMRFYRKLQSNTTHHYVPTGTGQLLFDGLLSSVIAAGIKHEKIYGSMKSLMLRQYMRTEQISVYGREKILNIKKHGYHTRKTPNISIWETKVIPYKVHFIEFSNRRFYVHWEKNGIEFFLSDSEKR